MHVVGSRQVMSSSFSLDAVLAGKRNAKVKLYGQDEVVANWMPGFQDSEIFIKKIMDQPGPRPVSEEHRIYRTAMHLAGRFLPSNHVTTPIYP